MDFTDLVRAGQLKEEATSPEKISEYLRFADDEIRAAQQLLPDFPAVAYKAAYDALIHAGNALIRSYGYRPTQKFTHVTIARFTEEALRKDSQALTNRFERMRRKRHPLLYEAVFLESTSEVKRAVKDAEQLLKLVKEHIAENNP